MSVATKTFTREDVQQHASPDSLWCIIDSTVYDLTDFAGAHPGGEAVLLEVAGKDATVAFYNLHRHEVLVKNDDLIIGSIEGEKSQVVTPKSGDLSQVPYGEPLWLARPFRSPYFKDSHHRLQQAMREFTDTHLYPEAQECESTGRFISQEMIDKMSELEILRMRMGPGRHLHGVTLMGGVLKGEDFDYFHDLIVTQELARVMARGFQEGNMMGMTIGMPAVLNFARDEAWQKAVCDDVFSGRKKICLAISEAFAGSDVARIHTTAEKTPDGKFYVGGLALQSFSYAANTSSRQIVNGSKKWITNGSWSDLFVTGVRTEKGLSVLLIERGEGVETKPIKTSYSATAGTAYVTFDNVKVPVANLLGEEGQGMRIILSNFNHERWMLVCKCFTSGP